MLADFVYIHGILSPTGFLKNSGGIPVGSFDNILAARARR
jgi:hypothetical protein